MWNLLTIFKSRNILKSPSLPYILNCEEIPHVKRKFKNDVMRAIKKMWNNFSTIGKSR
jgi:hypothetical protein